MTRVAEENSRFRQFIQYIEQGWKIDESVLLGVMWRPTHNANGGTYHFVLRNEFEDKTTMLSLPVSSQLISYLSENSIQINSLQ